MDAILENTDIFFEKIIYNLGRQMNLNADWRSFFTEIDNQTIKEIFPDAFISFALSVYPFVNKAKQQSHYWWTEENRLFSKNKFQ